MCRYITQSPMKLYSGRLKLAGRFFSKAKWPSQASALERLINAAFADGTPSSFAQANLVAGNCP
jgi:hypothetical protein